MLEGEEDTKQEKGEKDGGRKGWTEREGRDGR